MEYYQQLCTNKFNILDEINKFLQTPKSQSLFKKKEITLIYLLNTLNI